MADAFAQYAALVGLPVRVAPAFRTDPGRRRARLVRGSATTRIGVSLCDGHGSSGQKGDRDHSSATAWTPTSSTTRLDDARLVEVAGLDLRPDREESA